MTRPAGSARIASRSLLATVEITALALLAHLLAGGRLPSTGFVLAFAGVVFGCALLAIGRHLRIAAVVPLVLLAQVGLHASLDGSHVHPGVVEHATTGAAFGLTGPMLWAHLATTIVTAIVLLLQERVLAKVVASFRVLGLTPAPAASSRPVAFVGARVGRRALLSTSPRRGPPRHLCATS